MHFDSDFSTLTRFKAVLQRIVLSKLLSYCVD